MTNFDLFYFIFSSVYFKCLKCFEVECKHLSYLSFIIHSFFTESRVALMSMEEFFRRKFSGENIFVGTFFENDF